MSSADQATSSTSSTSNIRLITDAFEKYAKITGIDLSKNPFAAALEQSNSPEAILELLQEREKAFKEYREGSRRLINCLSPVVNVLQAFSGIFGEAFSLVSHATLQSGDPFFNLSLSDPLPTCKGTLCWDRYPSRRTSLYYNL
jgi:fungal STAND N-terminal Goodbye domain